MKIAICFSGQIRSGVISSKNIIKWIGDLLPAVDFFIHTWDINTDKSPRPDINDDLPINGKIISPMFEQIKQCQDVNEIVKIYNPKKIQVDNYLKIRNYFYDLWRQDYLIPLNLIDEPHNFWNPLFYSFYKSIDLKSEYENENNFKYDVVIKLRPDVVFPDEKFSINIGKFHYKSNSTNLIHDINKFLSDPTRFYVNGICPARIDDIFWLGNSQTMDDVSKYWQHNLSRYAYNMNDFCNSINVKTDTTGTQMYAINRMFFNEQPWVDIFLLDKFFHDFNFMSHFDNEKQFISTRQDISNICNRVENLIFDFIKLYDIKIQPYYSNSPEPILEKIKISQENGGILKLRNKK